MQIFGLIILIILSVLILFAIVCLFAKINLCIRFKLNNDGTSECNLSFLLFGGRYSKKIDLKEKKDSPQADKHKSDHENETEKNLPLTERIKKYYTVFLKIKYTWLKSKKKIRKNILIQKLALNIKLGLEDAAVTGTTTGVLWTAIYNVIAFISNFATLTPPDITITPMFDKECVEADGECIISFRIVNIIGILITVGINYYLVNKKLTKKEKAAINYGKSD